MRNQKKTAHHHIQFVVQPSLTRGECDEPVDDHMELILKFYQKRLRDYEPCLTTSELRSPPYGGEPHVGSYYVRNLHVKRVDTKLQFSFDTNLKDAFLIDIEKQSIVSSDDGNAITVPTTYLLEGRVQKSDAPPKKTTARPKAGTKKKIPSKYATRQSPPYTANDYCGQTMKGQKINRYGNWYYESRRTKRGHCTWQPVARLPPKHQIVDAPPTPPV